MSADTIESLTDIFEPGIFIDGRSRLVVDHRVIVRLALAFQFLFLFLVGIERAGIDTSFLRPVIAVTYLTFVPGTALLLVFDIRTTSFTNLIVYAVGLSLSTILIVGAVVSLVYPVIGITRPLSVVPLTVTMFGVVVYLIVGVLWRDIRRSVVIPTDELFSPIPLVLLLLPFASIFGTFLLDTHGDNRALLLLLIVIAFVPLIVAVRDLESKWFPLAVWVIALALLYHGGLWPFIDAPKLSVITMDSARWIPNYADGTGSLLPNGVIFPVYATLGGIALPVEVGVVNPFLISFLPVALFQAFRHRVGETHAFLAVCFFIFSYPFYVLYPGGGRVSTPVLFLALFVLVVSDRGVSRPTTHVLAIVFAAGIGVAHYGTAYVVMFALLISGSIFGTIRFFDRIRGMSARTDDHSPTQSPRADGDRPPESRILTIPFIGFYTAFVLAWYLYTGLSGKFGVLPKKVIAGMRGVLYGQLSGSATRSVVREYGTFSISASKQLYILIGGLMAIGVLASVLDRLLRDQRPVDDEFLALSVGFLALLGASFLPAGSGFAVARVMMIVFTVTAPFALVGFNRSVDVLGRLWTEIPMASVQSWIDLLGRRSSIPFAVILTLFLVLNAGVVSELATQDYAPSRKVSNERLVQSDDPELRLLATDCDECNVEIHAWIITRSDPTARVYADRLTTVQVDFYRGALLAQTGRITRKAYYTPIWMLSNRTSSSGYAVLLAHNYDTSVVTARYKFAWIPFGLESTFVRDDRIYDSGNRTVHRLAHR